VLKNIYTQKTYRRKTKFILVSIFCQQNQFHMSKFLTTTICIKIMDAPIHFKYRKLPLKTEASEVHFKPFSLYSLQYNGNKVQYKNFTYNQCNPLYSPSLELSVYPFHNKSLYTFSFLINYKNIKQYNCFHFINTYDRNFFKV